MISIIPYSKKAVLIQWDGPIRKDTISEVNLLNQQIQESRKEIFTETIPAFTSITVCYDKSIFSEVKFELEKLYRQLDLSPKSVEKRKWNLPLYIHEPIEKSILNQLNITSAIFYKELLSATFTIGMKGFLPGFIYLAGLPEHLHIPRKSTPDRSLPKGSVAIGGSQCGIYPKDSPGGWHVIGNCPIPLIDFNDENLSCFQVGDEVQFQSIDELKFNAYRKIEWTMKMITNGFCYE